MAAATIAGGWIGQEWRVVRQSVPLGRIAAVVQNHLSVVVGGPISRG